MPIEIRELIIKATVTQEGNPTSVSSYSRPSGNTASPSEEMIKACVEKVLEILENKKDR